MNRHNFIVASGFYNLAAADRRGEAAAAAIGRGTAVVGRPLRRHYRHMRNKMNKNQQQQQQQQCALLLKLSILKAHFIMT